MKELALHILDIIMNSVRANASEVSLEIVENTKDDSLSIIIKDNGCGMDDKMLKSVLDPFTTTRTTRKVGLGIPLFKANAEDCNGDFSITSKLDIGTTVIASFQISNIDRPILGDISNVITMVFCSHPDMSVSFTYRKDGDDFKISTLDIKEELGDVSLQNNEVKKLLQEIISCELDNMNIID